VDVNEDENGAVTGRHPALADPHNHLVHRRFTSMATHANVRGTLDLVLRVWGDNGRREEYAGTQWAATATAVDTVAALDLTHREVRPAMDRLELELIEQARAHGTTWAELAPVLGVKDRRGAQAYYRRLRDRAPTDVL
jgi:hypothetical protein